MGSLFLTKTTTLRGFVKLIFSFYHWIFGDVVLLLRAIIIVYLVNE